MKNQIKYDAKSMIINNKRIILFGGEMHYFRIPHQLWEDRLLKIKNAGCNFVSLYVPWNWHEPEKGEELWEGDHDLDHLLRLCKKNKLYVIIKPGPYINADWDCGGFPHWVLYNIEQESLRVNNEEYLNIVKLWYKKIIAKIKPHLFTNGGNIILFQIENEYDHLIELSDLSISDENAYDYLMYHLKLTRKLGVNIPVFTNEGKLIRGTEIIETRTFYPDIPWLWRWNFKHFDQKIKESISTQPDKPILIMELEAGWFSQYGQPLHEVSAKLPNVIIKNTFIQGASLFNLFMFAGGTTFPFWGCRGDISGVYPPGMGSTTSYDFGNPPVREWGELNTEKYYQTRALSLFFKTFPGFLFDTYQNSDSAKIISGGEQIRILNNKHAVNDNDFSYSDKKVMPLQRSNSKEGVLFVRNLEEESQEIALEYTSPVNLKKYRLPSNSTFTLPAHTALLIPLDVTIPGTDITIKYSTSELLTYKKMNKNTVFFIYGKKGLEGETFLKLKDRYIEVVKGKVQKKYTNDSVYITYKHNGLIILKIGSALLCIVDDQLAGRIWIEDKVILISDIYYINKFLLNRKTIDIEIEAEENENNTFFMILSDKPKNIIIDNKEMAFQYNKIDSLTYIQFVYTEEDNCFVDIKWKPLWKYQEDDNKKEMEYDDTKWMLLKNCTALERVGIYKHGYIWYRSYFNIPDDISEVRISFNTNELDRAAFYINGNFIWKGIGKAELNIGTHIISGKNILAICYENSFHTKGHPGEGDIVKYSGLQEPIIIKGIRRGRDYIVELKEFRVNKNWKKDFYKNDFDDSSWKSFEAGEKYICLKELGDYIWLRRRFYYKKDDKIVAPLKLTIKAAKERCLFFLNGKALGKFESIGPQHDFYIPEPFLQEENVLVILLEGPGDDNALLSEPKIEPFFQAKKRELRIVL